MGPLRSIQKRQESRNGPQSLFSIRNRASLLCIRCSVLHYFGLTAFHLHSCFTLSLKRHGLRWRPINCSLTSVDIAFIHSGYFYSASLKSTTTQRRFRHSTDIVSEFYPERHRQLRVKDLLKVSTWRLERNSNPQLFGRNATRLPMSRHTSHELTLRAACQTLIVYHI